MRRWVLVAALAAGCDDGGGGGGQVIDSDATGGADAAGQGGAGGGGGGGGQVPPDAEGPDAGLPIDAAVPDAAVECAPGTFHEPGSSLFVERTAEWGLEGVEGVLLSVGDIDGDGYADVIARRGGTRADVLEPGAEARHTWVLRNTGAGRFEDVTMASGFLAVRGTYPIAIGRPNTVVTFGDVDADGDLDVYSGVDMRTPPQIEGPDGPFTVQETSELLINDGNGSFSLTFPGDPLRRAGVEDVPSGAAFVDADLDGNLDLWMSQGGLGAPLQDRLFRGQGRGQMIDATAPAGLTTRDWDMASIGDLNAARGNTTAWSAQACDLNGDGLPELLAASYGRAPNHLWQATRDGDEVRYTNRSVASGYAYDENLGWQDNQFARCFCQANRDAPNCSDVPRPAIQCNQQNWNPNFDQEPFRNGGNSGATVCVDLNGDGHLDLYTTEIRHWWAGQASDWGEVLVNTGEADVRLTRPGRDATGLTLPHPAGNWDEGHITAGAIDYDNDGRQDIYVGGTDYPGNRGLLYQNISENGQVNFRAVAPEDFFLHWRSHGMAVADFDRDGDLDLIVGHSRARCSDDECAPTAQVRFFENQVADGGQSNWLQLDLRGARGTTNTFAVGARVTVRVGDRVLVQEVQGGYGHFGAQPDHVLHFGLGAGCVADVTIRWPDQALTEQTFRAVGGARYRVEQGQAPEVR